MNALAWTWSIAIDEGMMEHGLVMRAHARASETCGMTQSIDNMSYLGGNERTKLMFISQN